MAPFARQVDGRLKSSGTLGTFVCPVVNRIVRVGVIDGLKKGPPKIDVECPACGNRHSPVKPTWRKPTEWDEGRGVDVVIGEDGRSV
jgi:hypothetical protein